MSGRVVEFPHSVEWEVERMVELERGVCLLCLERCTMRVGDKAIYLYCRECGFQAYIRKERGCRNYGSFLKMVISRLKEFEGGGDDGCNEEDLG